MKTTDKAIIEKLKEEIAELKMQLNVKWFTPGSRLRKLEQEIASLEAQDKEPELTKDILRDILMAYVNYTDFDVKDVVNDEWLIDKFLNSIMTNLIAPKG